MRGEKVLWHRYVPGAGRDAYNRPVTGFAAPVPITGALFAPGSSSEPGPRASYRVVSQPTLILEKNPGVGPHDRFVIRGKLYEVTGDPDDWSTGMTSWNPGVEIALKGVTG